MFLAIDALGVGSLGTDSSVINGVATATFSSTVTTTACEGSTIGGANPPFLVADVTVTNSIVPVVIGDALNVAANIVDATAVAPPSATVTGDSNVSTAFTSVNATTNITATVSAAVNLSVPLSSIDIIDNITTIVTGDANTAITVLVDDAAITQQVSALVTSEVNILGSLAQIDIDTLLPDISAAVNLSVPLDTVDVLASITTNVTGNATNLVTSAVNVSTSPLGIGAFGTGGTLNLATSILNTDTVTSVTPITAVVTSEVNISGLLVQTDVATLLPSISAASSITGDIVDITIIEGTSNAIGGATIAALDISSITIEIPTAFAYEAIKPVIIPSNLLIADERYKVLIADSRYKTIVL